MRCLALSCMLFSQLVCFSSDCLLLFCFVAHLSTISLFPLSLSEARIHGCLCPTSHETRPNQPINHWQCASWSHIFTSQHAPYLSAHSLCKSGVNAEDSAVLSGPLPTVVQEKDHTMNSEAHWPYSYVGESLEMFLFS